MNTQSKCRQPRSSAQLPCTTMCGCRQAGTRAQRLKGSAQLRSDHIGVACGNVSMCTGRNGHSTCEQSCNSVVHSMWATTKLSLHAAVDGKSALHATPLCAHHPGAEGTRGMNRSDDTRGDAHDNAIKGSSDGPPERPPPPTPEPDNPPCFAVEEGRVRGASAARFARFAISPTSRTSISQIIVGRFHPSFCVRSICTASLI
jgi:hypothetical protein